MTGSFTKRFYLMESRDINGIQKKKGRGEKTFLYQAAKTLGRQTDVRLILIELIKLP